MKPTIFILAGKFYNTYFCYCVNNKRKVLDKTGFGFSPKEAYDDWILNNVR